MKKLYIIKLGTTFPATQKRLGDFDRWTSAGLGSVGVETAVVDAEHGADLPDDGQCAGVVVTGSHAMVTDDAPWSVRAEKWIVSLLDARVPVFGICYGHQLLARAAGGRVGYHPRGKEIGTVGVRLLPDRDGDPLFESLPASFSVHVTHAQSVLELPPQAVRLAANAHDPHQAFRLGNCAWGVQFHPEYNTDIMRAYIREQAGELVSAGRDVPQLLQAVSPTPFAAEILVKFGGFVFDRLTS